MKLFIKGLEQIKPPSDIREWEAGEPHEEKKSMDKGRLARETHSPRSMGGAFSRLGSSDVGRPGYSVHSGPEDKPPEKVHATGLTGPQATRLQTKAAARNPGRQFHVFEPGSSSPMDSITYGEKKSMDTEKGYPLGEGPKKTSGGAQVWLQKMPSAKKPDQKKIDLGTAPMMSRTDKALPAEGAPGGHLTPPKEYREGGATKKKEYADPNNFKYPIDTEEHVRAAISYFSKPKNAGVYGGKEQSAIWSRIRRAAKKFGIAVGAQSGPPSVEKKDSAMGKAMAMLATLRNPASLVDDLISKARPPGFATGGVTPQGWRGIHHEKAKIHAELKHDHESAAALGGSKNSAAHQKAADLHHEAMKLHQGSAADPHSSVARAHAFRASANAFSASSALEGSHVNKGCSASVMKDLEHMAGENKKVAPASPPTVAATSHKLGWKTPAMFQGGGSRKEALGTAPKQGATGAVKDAPEGVFTSAPAEPKPKPAAAPSWKPGQVITGQTVASSRPSPTPRKVASMTKSAIEILKGMIERSPGNPANENGPVHTTPHGGRGPAQTSVHGIDGPGNDAEENGPVRGAAFAGRDGNQNGAVHGTPHGGRGPAQTSVHGIDGPGNDSQMSKAVSSRAVPRMPRAMAMAMDTWRSATRVLTRGNSAFVDQVGASPLHGEIVDQGDGDGQYTPRLGPVLKSCSGCGRTFTLNKSDDSCPTCSRLPLSNMAKSRGGYLIPSSIE